MLSGDALIAHMGKKAQKLADEWTPQIGPFVQFITFALCHVYLEGANDALKDEIIRIQTPPADKVAAGVGGTGSTPQADRPRRTEARRAQG